MQDEAKDIRCGLILNIAVNKSVIYEYINETMISIYMCEEWDFTQAMYEDMFMEEFKSQYINVLNKTNNWDLNQEVYDIISNMVNEYMNNKYINKVYVVSDNE